MVAAWVSLPMAVNNIESFLPSRILTIMNFFLKSIQVAIKIIPIHHSFWDRRSFTYHPDDLSYHQNLQGRFLQIDMAYLQPLA